MALIYYPSSAGRTQLTSILPSPIAHQVGMWPPRGPVRVLLVLDHEHVLEQLVELTLTHGTFALQNAATWVQAVAALDTWQPHLALIDLELAEAALVEQMVGHGGRRLPVIGLTGRGDLKTKLAAFEAGVDDILTLPFAPEELLARVIALIRRSYRDAVTFTPVIKLGELKVDILNRTVRAGTSDLHLTSLEQSLLYLLAANAGRVVSRQEILDTLWGSDYVPESNVVDRQIRNLRARLHDDWKRPRFISTAPGRGYRFLPALTDVTGQARRA
jgi:two-component system, OmpR family, KDP operon response regulator KdpE